jgi:HlyD family secretion protein
MGDAVTLTAAALPAPIEGRIGMIGREVRRQTLTDASPAANTDTRVMRVTVDLEPSTTAARFVNLQVTARFAPRAGR